MRKKENGETMQMTVQQAAEALLMSASSVYSWVGRGKLRVKKTPSGKFILLSKKDIEEIRKINLESKRMKAYKPTFEPDKKLQEITENSSNLQETKNTQTNVVTNEEQIITKKSKSGAKINPEVNVSANTLELVRYIAELSEKAGMVGLLEDLQKKNADDAEYWRNKYFELQAEFNKVEAELAVLKEPKAREKKGFFSIFR